MEKGRRYLILEKDNDKLREWECIDVADSAYKVMDLVETRTSMLFGMSNRIKEPFWILKSKVDEVGMTHFRILEKLQ